MGNVCGRRGGRVARRVEQGFRDNPQVEVEGWRSVVRNHPRVDLSGGGGGRSGIVREVMRSVVPE